MKQKAHILAIMYTDEWNQKGSLISSISSLSIKECDGLDDSLDETQELYFDSELENISLFSSQENNGRPKLQRMKRELSSYEIYQFEKKNKDYLHN